ncbi:MAG: lipopolysaccharide heptosyltransferase I [Pyrinomonadaceae bacterium]
MKMKILIVKLSSIGDIIHTLPALAAIRRALPSAEISWVAESRSAEILRGNEFLKNLIEVDTRSLRGGKIIEKILLDAGRQIKNLRVSDFDIAIDFQGLLKSASIARVSKAKKRFGFDRESLREPLSRFLLTDTVKIEKGFNVIRKNLELAEKALNIKVPTENFEFPIFTGDEHKREAEEIINQTGENFAILNPAGGWETKLWQAEKFGKLADKLWEENNLFSIVATAPNETELAERALKVNKSGKIFHAAPSLKGFYELAKRAGVYVGGDTGPTHLAVAANAPVVGIFGPTDWQRNGSPNAQDVCVERLDLECRVNCYRRKIGSWKKGECGNWVCMEIAVETVYDAVQKRIEKP